MKKLLITCLLTTALDQITKQWVEMQMPHFSTYWVIPGWMGIHKTYNKGIIFGFFQDSGILVWGIILIAAGVLIYSTISEIRHPAHPFSLYALGFIWGGALGNLIDRVRTGKVLDFIAIWKWPIFNIADSSIVVGILILMLLYSREAKREAKSPGEAIHQDSNIGMKDLHQQSGEHTE